MFASFRQLVWSGLLSVLIAVTGTGSLQAGDENRLLVFAAASLKDVVEAVAEDYQKKTGIKVVVSAAGSSALARQVAAGAPADLFLSANPDWVDWLVTRGRLTTEDIQPFASNRLVVVQSAQSDRDPGTGGVTQSFPFGARIAVGDPDHVPVGIYARRALKELQLWDDLSKRLIRVDNTRVALSLVARGDVNQGIVYQTDAMIAPDVEIAGLFDTDPDAPILYVAAVLGEGDNPGARRFLAFLSGQEGVERLRAFGFEPLADR